MKRIVIGSFQDLERARAVVHDLAALHIPIDEISLISLISPGADEQTCDSDDFGAQETDVIKDAKTGAVVGGLAGLLLGLSPIFVPGIGLALVGGWLFTTLAGATLGGITGSFGGALVDMGMHPPLVHRYTEVVNQGNTLVIVRAYPELEAQIVALMERDGAVEVHERNAALV
jgi:uncharacterized membrane protein